MQAEEVRQLVAWAGEEGWNPGLRDADSFWNADPAGFLAMEEAGRMIGGGAVIRHDETFGFMGLFIVDKEFRGRKLGTQLWFSRRDRLLSRLAPGGTIGLDGVDAMVPFYEQGGFHPFTRHRRFQLASSSANLSRSAPIVDLRSFDLGSVADFDRHCFPARREHFLKDWIHQPGAVSLGYMKQEKLLGFGVMRPCLVGWKLGPLFAETPEVADELFQAFQLTRNQEPLFLDAPDNNPAALELCHRYALQEVFGCVRMYHGPAPHLDHHRIFGITTLEIG